MEVGDNNQDALRIWAEASPVGASYIDLVVDEDQANDAERSHTTEQVGYIVFAD